MSLNSFNETAILRRFSREIGTETSFTSNEETKKYNNIRKIKYSTTEQKTYGALH